MSKKYVDISCLLVDEYGFIADKFDLILDTEIAIINKSNIVKEVVFVQGDWDKIQTFLNMAKRHAITATPIQIF